MQIIFCLNDGISWGIMDEKRSITIQKNESCIYAGHGGTEYACYKKDSNFSFKSIKIPISRSCSQIILMGRKQRLTKRNFLMAFQKFL